MTIASSWKTMELPNHPPSTNYALANAYSVLQLAFYQLLQVYAE